jgi:hypothetical protein
MVSNTSELYLSLNEDDGAVTPENEPTVRECAWVPVKMVEPTRMVI